MLTLFLREISCKRFVSAGAKASGGGMVKGSPARLPLPLSRSLVALRTPRPASYHAVTTEDGRRDDPTPRWSERGVTGDDEAGAARLLIDPA